MPRRVSGGKVFCGNNIKSIALFNKFCLATNILFCKKRDVVTGEHSLIPRGKIYTHRNLTQKGLFKWTMKMHKLSIQSTLLG